MAGNYFLQKYGDSAFVESNKPTVQEPETDQRAGAAPVETANASGNYFVDTYGKDAYLDPEPTPPATAPRKETWRETIGAIPAQLGAGAAKIIAGSRLSDAEELQAARVKDGKPRDPGLDELIHENQGVIHQATIDPDVQPKGEQSLMQRGVQGGANMAYQGSAALAAGLAGGPLAAAGTLGAMTEAQKYGELREDQLESEKAKLHAGIQGMVTAATTVMPARALLTEGNPLTARLVNYLAQQLPGVTVGTVANALDDHIAKLPETATAQDVLDGLSEGVKQLPETMIATLAAGGVHSGVAHLALGRITASRPIAEKNPVDAVEAAQAHARSQAEMEGGDQLAQELAAAKAGAETGAIHDADFVKKATEVAQAQDSQNAHDQIRQEHIDALDELEKNPMEPELPKVNEPPATAEDAFALKEKTDEAQKESDLANAELQREAQKGVVAEYSAPEESGATLADIMPAEIKNLSSRPERSAAKAAEMAQKLVQTSESETETTKQEPAKSEPEKSPLAARREIEEQAHEAATSPKNELAEPTEAQREAGNYKKGHVSVQGLDISIENPTGSTRSGVTPQGEPWSTTMKDHYGYIRRTEGADGDHVDAFVGPHTDSDKVYVVDQLKQDTGGFDEHKTMIGYRNQLEAVRAYKRNFGKDWKMGPVKEMTMDEFKDWSKNGDTTKPVQPEKINEAMPATAEQVSQLAREGKRPDQRIRYSLPDEKVPKGGLKELLNEAQAHIDTGGSVHDVSINKPVPDWIQKQNKWNQALESESVKQKVKAVLRMGRAPTREQYEQWVKDELENNKVRYRLQDEESPITNNASGESAASQEAVNRVAQEKELGRDRYLIDRDGTVRPLTGVDAVDIPAREGQVIVQRNVGDKEWTITDRGGMSQMRANGALNAAREQLSQNFQKPEVSGIREARGWENAETSTGEKQEITLDEAKAAVEPLMKSMPGVKIHVHEDTKSMPEGPAKDAYIRSSKDGSHQNPRGFYVPDLDEVHLFSKGNVSKEGLLRTAIHEVVGHKGLKAVLKDRMGETMQDIYDHSDKKAIEEVAKSYGLDTSKVPDQRMAAEEYVARLAEGGIDSNVLRRAITAVRAGLRRIGLVRGWTNEDIKGLLRSARSARSKVEGKGTTPEQIADRRIRHALGEPDPSVNKQPENPLSQLAKFGATRESQMKYEPSILQKLRDQYYNLGESRGHSLIKDFLGAMPRDKLQDFVGKDANGKSKIPAITSYDRTAHKMDGRRNQLLVEVETTAKKWMKLTRKNSKEAATMGELMHAETLSGVDASKDYAPLKQGKAKTLEDRRKEVERRASYEALKPFWNKLSPEAKALHNEVRDAYTAMREKNDAAQEQRINDSAGNPNSKRLLLDLLRQKFEAGRVAGPYFPLARFGEYWGAAKSRAGEVVAASRFETPSEQREWRKTFEDQGYSTDGGRNMEAHTPVRSIDPEFAAKVTDLVQGMSPEIADNIWQMYMERLPELSMRKHMMHRQGRLGFSADALRAFGTNMFHSAHQLSKMEYVHKLQGHLDQMGKQVAKLATDKDPEAKFAQPLASEVLARHEWAMNPQSSPWAAAMTSFGFAYHLMASPAAGLVNMTQTAQVAMPVLAGEHGFLRANKELLKASVHVAGSKKFSGEEKQAMDEASITGLFSRTQAHLLASASNEEAFTLTSKRRQAMEIASWIFHKTEEFNRKSTFLAAFRLAKQKGAAFEDAFASADKLTMDSHFDVSNANRARYLQGNVGKVVGLFKNYSLNMTYRLARDFRESIRVQTTDPAARAAAQKRFAGMLTTTFLLSGVSGLPMVWLAHAVINTVFGDKDTDFDSESAFRAYLTEVRGAHQATAIVKGPMEAATGASISSRVGLNNLWIQAPPENMEGNDLNYFYLKQAAGPAISPVLDIAPAAKLANQGYYDRAVEKLVPKFVADGLKAWRYATQGEIGTNGDVMMSKDEFTAKQLFFQSIGFVPAELSARKEQGMAVQEAAQKLTKRKHLLMDKLFLAQRTQDESGVAAAFQAIQEFDKKNPGFPIDAKNVLQSAISRAKFNARAVDGVTIDPKLGYLHNKYRFTPKAEEQAR